MALNAPKIIRNRRITNVTSSILGGLVLVFFILTYILSTQIIDQLIAIQDHPFPVTLETGRIETKLAQMHDLSERLVFIRTKEVRDSVDREYDNIYQSLETSAQEIVDRYLPSKNDSLKLQELVREFKVINEEFLTLCGDETVSTEIIADYVNNKIEPILEEMANLTGTIQENASMKFNSFVEEGVSFRLTLITLSLVITISVIIGLVIFNLILHRKDNEESKLMEHMEVALAAAKTANTAKTQFLSNMSHDIRTPMNAIIGMTTIAGSNIDNPIKVKDCLTKIATSSKHLLGLINDVLDMSKIESGKIIIIEEPFSLSQLTHSLFSIISPQAKAKSINFELAVNELRNEQVIGDSTRIQQVIINLLGNAIKFTPEGGTVKLTLNQKPSAHYGYYKYEFIISDTGIGMSGEFLSRIFEPFEREKTATVSKIEGTGLGLAISKNIVEMMGGSINVESVVNCGSTFTLQLHLKSHETELVYEVERFKGLRTLVVDDEQEICEDTVRILEEIGISGDWVISGREAVEYVQKAHLACEDYHSVIIDWKMPDMNGIETTRKIRSIMGDNIPIIILTAYDWSDIEEEAKEAGVTAFLLKPLFKSRIYDIMSDLALCHKPIESMTKQHKKESEDIFSAKVLLAEDNDINAEIVEELLKEFDISVKTVINGQLAVDEFISAEENEYQLIFMDIQMPIMDGYTATKEIRKYEVQQSRQAIPIVAMSANAFAEDIEHAKRVGMNDYITKPISVEQLNRVIKMFIHK